MYTYMMLIKFEGLNLAQLNFFKRT